MRTLLIAAASAIFFAAVVTELSTRVWPESYIALLLLATVALFLSGLLNLKLAGATAGASTGAAASAGAGAEARPRDRSDRGRGDKDKPRGNGGQQKRKAAPAQPAPPAGPRETGTVKWFNRTKGFGFVIRESGEEIFVHQRSIRAEGQGDERRRPMLRDGQAVSFVVAEREKGLQAEDVLPADDE